uniref:Upstream transcription factor family member 3 n=1 Tax=Tetraodon nigroviridis TaxID=99883 RepID=H3D5A6_TETNG
MILDQAFRYITELKKQNDTMLLEGGDKVQVEEIRRLRRQLEELRRESAHYIELLKAHDINFLEDPTIHWKGKQRCAKVAKVTPTHQLPKGIIVYSNNNVICPAGKDTSPPKQPSESLFLQPPSDVGARLRVNGPLLQVDSSSSTPTPLPGAGRTNQSASVPLMEQCVMETQSTPSSLPPSVSYITLQIPAVTSAVLQAPQRSSSASDLAIASSQPTSDGCAELAPSHKTFANAVTTPRQGAAEGSSWVSQGTTGRTVSSISVPSSQAPLRTGAAGSTQTTWTTLQMAGNTVQPVCQSLVTPEPFQIQMQPRVPVQQAPITAHVQRPSQLQPAIQKQPQPLIAPQPQCAVLPQAAIVPQPALVPQPQAAVLPLLQSMQVLQVNAAAGATASVTAPPNTNNPSLVILQQANACPAQPAVREEMANQAPCQHIVIIQAPNQAATAAQNPPVGIVPAPAVPAAVPAAVPVMSIQIPATSSMPVAPVQSVGGKQLVHILPRPVQPQVNSPLQVTQASSSPPAPPTPQTITVNGQVFALQPMKTSEKSSPPSGQSMLQLVQPTTTEEPNINVALNSLGALSTLNQSISQGLPITLSNQGNDQPSPAASSAASQAVLPPTGPLRDVPTTSSKTGATTDCSKAAAANVTSAEMVRSVCSLSSEGTPPPRQSHPSSTDSAPAAPACVTGSLNTSSVTTAGPSVSATSLKPPVSSPVAAESKPAEDSDAAAATGRSVSGAKEATAATATGTKQSKAAAGEDPVQSKPLPSESLPPSASAALSSASQTTVCTSNIATNSEVFTHQVSQRNSICQFSRPSLPHKLSPQATASSAALTTMPLPSPTATFAAAGRSGAVSEFKNGATTHGAVMSNHPPCSRADFRTARSAVGGAAGTQTERRSSVKEDLMAVSSDASSTKDFVLSQQMYAELGDQMNEQSASRQTDSPLSAGAGGGRGFSVASMLPQGHGIGAASSSFGTFTFTKEQEEMLALAMLDPSSPGRRSVGCSGDNTASGDTAAAPCEPAKTGPLPSSKEMGSTGHQSKMTKTMDVAAVKPAVQISARGQGGEVQTQSSSTVTSLSVNNLIRPNSGQQPYPNSPGLPGQQVPSPVGTHISSNNTLSPCAGAAQLSEFTPLKTALNVKSISKRQAPDEVMLSNGKRPKPCLSSASAVAHVDVKAPDHSQMMVGQLPRIHTESAAPLFSTNSFMSPIARSADGHCPPQGPPEQNQPGVLHLPQGHPQHGAQPGQHMGGNPYLRHHLYHLQHHLSQPDPVQRHSLHQRALQQQEQQQQHAQKKRGLVRGSQSGSPAGLQQKQHHMEKSGVQQQPHSHQQGQHQPHQSHHHFRHQEKSCEGQAAGSRGHHNTHLAQQEHLKVGTHVQSASTDWRHPNQDHNVMQRMMSSRTLEQQLISPPSNPVSRTSELACAPSRQERHRVSNYSAEALIGKSSTSGEQQQRMGLHLQASRGAAQEQPDLRSYLDTSRGKTNIGHSQQSRLPAEHADVQRVSECPPFKAMGGAGPQLGGFESQVSRGNDMAPKTGPPSQRGPQGGQQGGFRMGVGPAADARHRGGYSTAHPGSQAVQVGPALPREQDGCHQTFMQSLLSPHLPEQNNHQRVQCCPPVSMEYSCVSGSSSGDIQTKVSSPSGPPTQKAPGMRLGEANKSHISQVSSNMHAGPGVRACLPHPPTPHSSSEPGRPPAPSRALTAVSQHSRNIGRDNQPAKLRPGERARAGNLRNSNSFDPEGHLPLPFLLGRPQSRGEARRSTIVRFMAESAPAPSDNNLVPDQHLAQNFGFPFIPEGGMNPPPPINANSTFIPPVSQPSASRTPSLLPVEPQNTLPSFYPPYSPAAHPSLPSDVTLQYFPNQMFTSPSADKGSAPPLNNRFGSILSPPRPVGFGQASFPLLPDMPPMPITNSSGITPHISNFSLTSLFPEIATGMPTDGSSMPMSPLLSLSNTSAADSGKQPNRPAHNISHILGHDGSSAV